ncbi:MAG: hypothetical protein HY825_12085 [Acidobacteria bacterium]|nr:hypothetical protein [Acidobacteriota bacterium]
MSSEPDGRLVPRRFPRHGPPPSPGGRRRATLAATLLAVSLLGAVPAWPLDDPAEGEADGPSIGLELDVASRYLWRGFAWGDGAVVQPSTWLTHGALWVELWSNAERDPDGSTFAEWRATELDLTIGYETAWRGVTITPALAVYDYDDDEDSPTTAEVVVELSVPAGPFEVVSSHAFDVDEYHGAYYGDLGLALVRQLGEGTEARVSGTTGWASQEFTEVYGGVAVGGLFLLGVTAAVEHCLERGPCVRLHGEATRITRGDLAEAAGGRSQWNVGVAVGHEF